MFLYEDLIKDKNIVSIYDKIDKEDKKPWALHGMQHINNVVKITEDILTQLKCSDDVIECGKISAYLHDVGMIDGKENHAENSAKFVKDYLINKDLSEEQKNIIVNAIKNHSNYQKDTDLISSVLIFADKIDVDKTRLGKEGYNVEGLKELAYVDKIEFVINKTLKVFFKCSSNFNKENFENFYFCKKIFIAIKQFSEYLKKDYKVFINNKIWDYDKKNSTTIYPNSSVE